MATKKKITPEKSCDTFCSTYQETDTMEGILDGSIAAALKDFYACYNPDTRTITAYDDQGNATTNAEDAKSIWFSLEKLKKFIWYIEHFCCKNECGYEEKDLGVRIHYARYPDKGSELWKSPSLQGVPLRYANRHTLFMIPTYYDKKLGGDVDFNPKKGCHKDFVLVNENFNPKDLIITQPKPSPVQSKKDMDHDKDCDYQEPTIRRIETKFNPVSATKIEHFNGVFSISPLIRQTTTLQTFADSTTSLDAQNHGGLIPPDTAY